MLLGHEYYANVTVMCILECQIIYILLHNLVFYTFKVLQRI